jgi:hypothetical protein
MSNGDGRPKDYSKVGVQNLQKINYDNGLFHRLSLCMTYTTGYPCNGRKKYNKNNCVA